MSKNEPTNLYLRRSIFIGGEPHPRGAILDPAKNKHLTDKVVRDLIASASVERTDRKPRAKPPAPKPAKPEGSEGTGDNAGNSGAEGES
ncbi:hypothetical protein [Thioalkalivibrio sp. ALgr3]|uniref:hypothetical protein n=1 Tax=Thioalkalivibrio sp. ALgr3 TaxID=1239292 RepID=UPI000372E15B|nr:hypothetical protein [Thioalkalivibrio sp. ALgr3]